MLGGIAGLLVLVALRREGARKPVGGWPVNLAHRGASAGAPENTLEAFRRAIKEEAGGLELDLHLTHDGHVVVVHDDTVDRTTNGTGAVQEMALAELKALDAGYRFTRDGVSYPYRGRGVKIPTLREVLQEFPDFAVNMEIKEARSGIEEAVLQEIGGYGSGKRTLVASEKHGIIERFRRISGGEVATSASRWEIGVFYVLSCLHLERLLRPAYTALQVPVYHRGTRVVTPRFVRAAHDRGVRVDVWTVDDADEMRRLLEMGVDTIMTNRPAVLSAVLKERRTVLPVEHR